MGSDSFLVGILDYLGTLLKAPRALLNFSQFTHALTGFIGEVTFHYPLRTCFLFFHIIYLLVID